MLAIMDKKKIFIVLGFFWLVLLGGFIGFKEFTIKTGQEVLLKTLPVDPRDPFRGDYVVLRYDIGRIDLSKIPGAPLFNANDAIYAEIEKGSDGYGKLVSLSKTAPTGKLFIKGVVKYANSSNIQAEYGIESYFVPANKGYAIEQKRGNGVDAKVSVDTFGNAIVKTLLIEGKEIDFNSI